MTVKVINKLTSKVRVWVTSHDLFSGSQSAWYAIEAGKSETWSRSAENKVTVEYAGKEYSVTTSGHNTFVITKYGVKAAEPGLWKTPLHASKKDLAAVSNYLGKLLDNAGHGDDTDPEVYQEKCAKEFGQAFDSEAWDDWFDKEVERFKSKTGGESDSKKIWETPADMFLADLAAVLKYLCELIDEAGPDGHIKTHVYQKKCTIQFDQAFDSDAWDEWFDETIEQLENGSSERPVWKVPSDATKMDRAEIRSYLSGLLDKAGPDQSVDTDMYQEKCADEFDQEFDSHAWDNWFDKEIARLKEYRVQGHRR